MSQTQETPTPALPIPTRPFSEPTTPTIPTTPFTISPPPTPKLPHKPTEPLYTEIRIPLPPVHSQSPPSCGNNNDTVSKSRSRAHTLHSMSPFHRRRSSNSSSNSSPSASRSSSPRVSSEEGKRNEMAMMRFGRAREAKETKTKKRSGTIDALAVAPAVMILRAELFTPREQEEERQER